MIIRNVRKEQYTSSKTSVAQCVQLTVKQETLVRQFTVLYLYVAAVATSSE